MPECPLERINVGRDSRRRFQYKATLTEDQNDVIVLSMRKVSVFRENVLLFAGYFDRSVQIGNSYWILLSSINLDSSISRKCEASALLGDIVGVLFKRECGSHQRVMAMKTRS